MKERSRSPAVIRLVASCFAIIAMLFAWSTATTTPLLAATEAIRAPSLDTSALPGIATTAQGFTQVTQTKVQDSFVTFTERITPAVMAGFTLTRAVNATSTSSLVMAMIDNRAKADSATLVGAQYNWQKIIAAISSRPRSESPGEVAVVVTTSLCGINNPNIDDVSTGEHTFT